MEASDLATTLECHVLFLVGALGALMNSLLIIIVITSKGLRVNSGIFFLHQALLEIVKAIYALLYATHISTKIEYVDEKRHDIEVSPCLSYPFSFSNQIIEVFI